MNKQTATVTDIDIYADQKIPVPPGFNEKILEDVNLCKRYEEIISAYNPKYKIGAVYDLRVEQWITFFPIEIEAFAQRVGKVVSDNEAKRAKLN